jgi:hypothetical protein
MSKGRVFTGLFSRLRTSRLSICPMRGDILVRRLSSMIKFDMLFIENNSLGRSLNLLCDKTSSFKHVRRLMDAGNRVRRLFSRCNCSKYAREVISVPMLVILNCSRSRPLEILDLQRRKRYFKDISKPCDIMNGGGIFTGLNEILTIFNLQVWKRPPKPLGKFSIQLCERFMSVSWDQHDVPLQTLDNRLLARQRDTNEVQFLRVGGMNVRKLPETSRD